MTTDNVTATPNLTASKGNPIYSGAVGSYSGITINYPKNAITRKSMASWYHSQVDAQAATGDLRSFVTKDVITTQAYDGNMWLTIN